MMMFSVRAFLEGTSRDKLSRQACLHYATTLKILQARLNEIDKTAAMSDGTIMAIFFLASSAEIMEDLATVSNHIKGLEKIVGLRGGVRALTTNNNLQVKVCRWVLTELSASCSSVLLTYYLGQICPTPYCPAINPVFSKKEYHGIVSSPIVV
jgi:hypothetical protein